MKRREFITLLGSAASWPLAARAQQPAMPVVGFLGGSSLAERRPMLASFRQALAEGGYVVGQNVAIEYRWADGQYDRLPTLAADLVRRQVAVIVAGDGLSALAAKAATTTIPIVFSTGIDPVQGGLVTSLSRPGGNLTGFNLIAGPLQAKQIGLLHELVPAAKIIAVLINPNNANAEHDATTVQDAARAIGLRLLVTRAADESDPATVFATLAREGAGGLLVKSDIFFTSRRDQIVALAARVALPLMSFWREFPLAGGLISYGPSVSAAYRQIGVYTAKIINGAKPGDLPVMQPTTFELVINLKTAKALGLEVPLHLQQLADEVIEVRRREFITLFGGAAAAWPLAAHAQQSAMPVIGYLSSASPDVYGIRLRAFHQGLKETGYIEGQNVAVEYRWAEGQNHRLPALAGELVQRQVSVIAAAGGTPGAVAAKGATATIPIVLGVAVDPVEVGLVASLNRPGDNLTGVTNLNVEVAPKRLELLHELVPSATIVALLVNPTSPSIAEPFSRAVQAAATALGLQLHILQASTESDFDMVFARPIQLRAGGLVIMPDVFFNARSEQLAALTLRYAVPAVYHYREFAAAGGLMSYGSNETDYYRLVGIYVGRILKGEKPSDLPVQQSTKVDLIINLKTAKALGVTVPLPLLGRADEVIE